MMLCAYITGGTITYYEAKRQHRATEAILRVSLGALAGGLIGAKASMLIFLGPATFIKDLSFLWYSGQAWTGAFFGGYLGVLLVKRFNHITYPTGDLFALGLPLAQAIGRLGNLLGGDPFGLPSNLPWAIVQHGVRRQPSSSFSSSAYVIKCPMLAISSNSMSLGTAAFASWSILPAPIHASLRASLWFNWPTPLLFSSLPTISGIR